jgi:hypothetical protein
MAFGLALGDELAGSGARGFVDAGRAQQDIGPLLPLTSLPLYLVFGESILAGSLLSPATAISPPASARRRSVQGSRHTASTASAVTPDNNGTRKPTPRLLDELGFRSSPPTFSRLADRSPQSHLRRLKKLWLPAYDRIAAQAVKAERHSAARRSSRWPPMSHC